MTIYEYGDGDGNDYTDTELRVARFYQEEKMGKREQLESRLLAHAEAARKAAEELENLKDRKPEPGVDSVIAWQHRFRGSTAYDYVAYRFGKSVRGWVIAGPTNQNKYYTWDELMDFVESRSNSNDPIWIAKEWVRL